MTTVTETETGARHPSDSGAGGAVVAAETSRGPTAATRPGGQPVRVAHLSLTLATGGLERLLTDFARLHNQDQYELEFIAVHQLGRFAEEIRQAGCPVRQLQSTGRFSRLNELRSVLRQRRIQILHTHNTWPHLYGTLTARLAGVPVVVNTRHGQRLGHGWRSRLPYRLASQFTDRIVAVSDDAARLCCQADGIPSRRVQRIWNGIDTDKFAMPERSRAAETGTASRPIRAISVARLSPEKDFPTLLRAVALAREQVPELTLQIAGNGPQMGELEALRRELQLEASVELLGDCSNVPQLLAGADLFVSSSLSEGISLTLLEAMAVGLPIVATAVGGNPEIVVEEETGRLVPSASPERLAEALQEMCRQRDRWAVMGRAGRQRVEQHFDVRRMVSDYEDLYGELLASHACR